MEAGRLAVKRVALSEEVRALTNAGFKVTSDMTAEAIKVNYMLATGVHAVSPEGRTRHCWICGRTHRHGERCPDGGSKHITNVWRTLPDHGTDV
jgi:hypothetical protein